MRINYVDLIKGIEDEKTINIIGKIDCESLLETNGDNLLYIFPLIEKMVLEIYKLNPESNVEDYSQGIMKTTNSIFESNASLSLIPENLIVLIKKYFANDGLRNKLFHVNESIVGVEVDYSEINYIIMHLLSILKNQIMNKSNDKNKIELL